jgi:hypothetical protein
MGRCVQWSHLLTLEQEVGEGEERGRGRASPEMGGNLAKELLSLALFALPDGHLRLLPGCISGRYQRRPVAIQANLLRRVHTLPGCRCSA